jgi:Eco29kI-like restriction endonuclease
MLVSGREDDMNSAAVADALKGLLEVLPEDMAAADISSITARRRKQLRELIREAIQRLESVAAGLDPVQVPRVVFDPSNPEVIGKLIGDTMLEQPRGPLGSTLRFYGSGVYAIYYTGDFPAYEPISGTDTPIYVGKADPAILDARTPVEQGERLYGRLNGDHARSIRQAEDHAKVKLAAVEPWIKLSDFECRYLVVRSAWQRTAEDYLIGRFKPIWNDEVGICFGFGKHGDAPTTRANTRSPWDTLHPGRPWATREGNLPNPLTAEQIIERILEHYKQNPPLPRSLTGGS